MGKVRINQGEVRHLEREAEKWLQLEAKRGVKGQTVIKSNEHGILTERQMRRFTDEYEIPFSQFQPDSTQEEWGAVDWLQEQKGNRIVTESEPVVKPADKAYVVGIVQAQVKQFMNSADADKVTEKQALAFELVYNQGMSLTQAGNVMGIHRTNVSRNLVSLFELAGLELYCGINVKDAVLEKFMHPSILALRNAKARWKAVPKISKEKREQQAEEYGLNAPTFHWTVQDGTNPSHPLNIKKDLA